MLILTAVGTSNLTVYAVIIRRGEYSTARSTDCACNLSSDTNRMIKNNGRTCRTAKHNRRKEFTLSLEEPKGQRLIG
jgi:hypothetical protein